MRREQTLILGDKPVTLEHAFDEPRTYTSRKELKRDLQQAKIWHPYFNDTLG